MSKPSSTKNDEKPATKEPTRRERKKQQTRARLIQAIFQLTATQGINSVTIRDIAEKADIGLGSFYRYFESKEALLDQAIIEIMFKSGEQIDATATAFTDPVYKIATAFTMFENIASNNPLLAWFMLNIQDYRPELGATLLERLKRDIEEGIEKGVFHVPNMNVTLRMIGASVFEFQRDRLHRNITEDEIPHFVHILLRAIGTEDQTARKAAHEVWQKQTN